MRTTLLAVLLLFAAVAVAETDSEKPLCTLLVRAFDADGKQFQFTTQFNQARPEFHVVVFLWQKIVDSEFVQVTKRQEPIVRSPDGSTWQRVAVAHLGIPGWQPQWGLYKKVEPGEYRLSFTIRNNSPNDGKGCAEPERIRGWGLSDVIVVAPGEESKTVDIHPDTGPKVRIRTAFFPDPAADTKPDDDNEEARNMEIRIFREENFVTDRLEMGQYGIPRYVDFDQMKPSKYHVLFYQRRVPPESGTTAATDVFSFEVTEDGPNDFVFTPDKSLAKNAVWQILGTVRDEKGTPLPNIDVTLTGPVPPGVVENFEDVSWNHDHSKTDAEGKYHFVVEPSMSQFGVSFDPTNRWRWGFRVQQATIQVAYPYPSVAPDREQDVIIFGELATDELKKQIVDRSKNVVFVEMNKPAVIDFTLPPQGQKIPWEELEKNPERRKKRFDTLQRRKTYTDSDSYKLFREVVLPNSLNREYVEAATIGSKISATLTTDKPVYTTKESVNLTWNIVNGSDYDVLIMTDEAMMGDSATVWVESDTGEFFLEHEQHWRTHDGPVRCERIPPKGSFAYKINPPYDYLTAGLAGLPGLPAKGLQPGRYTFNVARNLPVRRIEPAKDDKRWVDWHDPGWMSVSVPICSSVTVDVVLPDEPTPNTH